MCGCCHAEFRSDFFAETATTRNFQAEGRFRARISVLSPSVRTSERNCGTTWSSSHFRLQHYCRYQYQATKSAAWRPLKFHVPLAGISNDDARVVPGGRSKENKICVLAVQWIRPDKQSAAPTPYRFSGWRISLSLRAMISTTSRGRHRFERMLAPRPKPVASSTQYPASANPFCRSAPVTRSCGKASFPECFSRCC